MNYKVIIYIFFAFLSAYGVSSINFDGFIKKGKVWEARVLAMILIFSLAYLAANFFLTFSELTSL